MSSFVEDTGEESVFCIFKVFEAVLHFLAHDPFLLQSQQCPVYYSGTLLSSFSFYNYIELIWTNQDKAVSQPLSLSLSISLT